MTLVAIDNPLIVLKQAVSPNSFRDLAKQLLCNDPLLVDDIILLYKSAGWVDDKRRGKQVLSLLEKVQEALQDESTQAHEYRHIIRAMLKRTKRIKSLKGYRNSQANAKRRKGQKQRKQSHIRHQQRQKRR